MTSKVLFVGLIGALLAGSMLIVSSPGAAAGEKTSGTKDTHVTVQFLGDSVALTLGIAMADEKLESKYDYTVRDGGILGCGVVDGPLVRVRGVVKPVDSACNGSTPAADAPIDVQPWQVQWQKDLAEHHPNVVVLVAGRWEVVDRIYNGQWTNILDPSFAGYVKQQLQLAASIVAASGAKLVFMTAPCTHESPQPDGTPWPEDDATRLDAYNQLVEQVASEDPKMDSVVNLDSVVCPGGNFSFKYKGVTIRQPDGVHFAIRGGAVLEHAIMPDVLAEGRTQISEQGSKTKKK